MSKSVGNSKKSNTPFSERVRNKNEPGIDFSDVGEWKTLKTYAKEHQQFTLDQLRLLARYRDTNGLSDVCKKIGKTLYLHDSGFSLWISQQ